MKNITALETVWLMDYAISGIESEIDNIIQRNARDKLLGRTTDANKIQKSIENKIRLMSLAEHLKKLATDEEAKQFAADFSFLKPEK